MILDVFLFLGAKVEPVLVEDINFYKAKFGKEPPCKKVKPSPAVTEKHYGIDNLTKLTIEQHKINLKRNIYLANQGNSLPPIYHILGNKTDTHPSVAATHELPHTMEADDINIVYSHEIEVITDEENTEIMISPIKNHPASLHDILSKAESIMDRIRVDDEKAREIEECTRDQSQSSMWFAHRAPRITASKCKRALMKETTSPSKAMGEILYNSNYQSEHMRDGIKSEAEVIKEYSKQTGNTVQQCGFFVSKSHPFLGASPDGLIGRDGAIEVKKIHPRMGETLESALLRLNIIKRTDGCLSVNENHQYYYQMQQQLFCAERKWVDFIASDGYALFVKRVLLDHDFWTRNLPRLQRFYYNVILLELAYPRVKDGLERIGKCGIDFSTLSALRKQ